MEQTREQKLDAKHEMLRARRLAREAREASGRAIINRAISR
jgi:hypothetical protein